MYNKFFFENLAIYEIMQKNMVDSDRPQMTIFLMRFACCIPEVTDTHSEYVTLIAFLRRKRKHERASMLRYTYISCIIYYFQQQ